VAGCSFGASLGGVHPQQIRGGWGLVGRSVSAPQQEARYTSAVAAEVKEAEAANAFIQLQTTPASAALIKSKGRIPGEGAASTAGPSPSSHA